MNKIVFRAMVTLLLKHIKVYDTPLNRLLYTTIAQSTL